MARLCAMRDDAATRPQGLDIASTVNWPTVLIPAWQNAR
jgi:hypothetical protein